MQLFTLLAARKTQALAFLGMTVGGVMLVVAGMEAHGAITSKYTFNEDVYPLLRDKCGRCHSEGGSAPMSLMVYKDNSGGAAAWAESIREMLVSEAMPPWYVDPTSPPVKNNHSLTAKEIDLLVTWASGGTPQGDLNRVPTAAPLQSHWVLGPPDVTLTMEQAHVVAAGTLEETVDLVLPTGFTDARWVRAVDLLPGVPSMVRRAKISVQNGPVLAVWEPGDDSVSAPGGTAFKIPAGAKLAVQIQYKKSWQDEAKSLSDRSTVGLYLTDEPLSGKSIEGFTVEGPNGDATGPRTFSKRLAAGGRVLAVRPELDGPYAAMEVTAVSSTGRRTPLLKLRAPRPEWPRRYWLADPIELAAGTTIEITALPGDPDSGPLMAAVKQPLQVGLDIAPQ